MSMGAFPERVDIRKAFAKNARYDAVIPVGSFKRLEGYLFSADDAVNRIETSKTPVNVQIEFVRDEQNSRLISGKIATQVQVQCQRCLNTMTVELRASLELKVADSDEAAREMIDDNAIIPSEDGIDILSLVEDELILCLPIAPRHSNDDCNQALNTLNRANESTENESQCSHRGNDEVMEKLLQLKRTLSKK